MRDGEQSTVQQSIGSGSLDRMVPDVFSIRNFSNSPPLYRIVATSVADPRLTRCKRVQDRNLGTHPTPPSPARVGDVIDHLVAEKAKIGGFLRNPSQ